MHQLIRKLAQILDHLVVLING
uniref:Uncharacterized protein n=1 Tax=Arundo donax TaxID=35708 RepID=A0A0A9F2V3_ARUDO